MAALEDKSRELAASENVEHASEQIPSVACAHEGQEAARLPELAVELELSEELVLAAQREYQSFILKQGGTAAVEEPLEQGYRLYVELAEHVVNELAKFSSTAHTAPERRKTHVYVPPEKGGSEGAGIEICICDELNQVVHRVPYRAQLSVTPKVPGTKMYFAVADQCEGPESVTDKEQEPSKSAQPQNPNASSNRVHFAGSSTTRVTALLAAKDDINMCRPYEPSSYNEVVVMPDRCTHEHKRHCLGTGYSATVMVTTVISMKSVTLKNAMFRAPKTCADPPRYPENDYCANIACHHSIADSKAAHSRYAKRHCKRSPPFPHNACSGARSAVLR
ncbi:hypothetical protein FVE85_3310 [Porphyridium purpureum]|uniref:Uncharacterized protein n=1 Tax=Porphyridium purpureum TaxID=35688 RepID=A0A5J4YU89_PORPP|nr:hypothetical protein FVE85_3310 [Porphyridium purpureum]|eukprot:POR1628..scf227_4